MHFVRTVHVNFNVKLKNTNVEYSCGKGFSNVRQVCGHMGKCEQRPGLRSMGGSYTWIDRNDEGDDDVVLQTSITPDLVPNQDPTTNDMDLQSPISENVDYSSMAPTSDYLMYQQMWLELKDSDVQHFSRLRRIRDNCGDLQNVMWEDYMDLFKFINDRGLSEHDGDDLIKLVRGFEVRHRASLSLPKVFKTVKRCLFRQAERLNISSQTLTLPFPEEYFGKEDEHNLQPATSVLLDIFETVRSICLIFNV